MLSYRVEDMTCGHCASAITKAVRAVDAGAKVEVDLAAHLVHIDPTEADAAGLREAIQQAGYTALPVENQDTAGRSAKRGGCCGCCQ